MDKVMGVQTLNVQVVFSFRNLIGRQNTNWIVANHCKNCYNPCLMAVERLGKLEELLEELASELPPGHPDRRFFAHVKARTRERINDPKRQEKIADFNGTSVRRPERPSRDEINKPLDRILDLVLEKHPSVGEGKSTTIYEVSRETVLGRERWGQLVKVRKEVTMHAIRILGIGVSDLGDYFGHADHSTVSHYEQDMERKLARDPEYRQSFLAENERIRQTLQEEGLL